MGSVDRIVDRAIPLDDVARVAAWEKSEVRRKREIYLRKISCAVEATVWPFSPKIFAFIGTAVASFCLMQLEMLTETAIYMSWMFLISLLLLVKTFIACLLRYRGWLSTGRVTTRTKIWGLLMKSLIPANSTHYCFKTVLPPLPFPNSLKVTVTKFVESMRPVLSEKEMSDLERKADEFLKTIGWRLQFVLLLRAIWKWNWFADWWKQYVYLANRKPLFCSNVAGGDSYRIQYNRMDRIAVWTFGTWKYFVEGRHNGTLLQQMTLNGIIPLCMDTVKHVTGSTRVPKEDIDEHSWNDPLEIGYIVVQSRGNYYKIFMYDDKGAMLCPGTLKILFEQIWIDSNLRGSNQRNPAIFTCLPRVQWADIRTRLNKISPQALEDVEKAGFLVNLEDECSDSNGDYYLYGNHGHGRVWLDKSLSFTTFKSGRIITMFEHSCFDGLVMSLGKNFAVIEEFFAHEINGFSWFDKKGLNTIENGVYNAGGFREPAMIDFGDLSSLDGDFDKARQFLANDALDVQVGHMLADNVDRKLAKKVKLSPEGLIQCAIQATTYKMHKRVFLTYQPATLQHFSYGRTENIRPLTMNKKLFAEALYDESLTDSEKFNRLKLAIDEHSELIKSAMAMRGIDRHLFGLYVVMRGQGLESEFLDFVVNEGMQAPMCTSCVPPKVSDKLKSLSKFDEVTFCLSL